ncbi:MAG: L-threonylcarbamoyladenylate synthase [Defluviitaleaceae bacterium]|nr:L-threonylcarbamoyladenylate synthase [Defluviitaleaceae bacterium]
MITKVKNVASVSPQEYNEIFKEAGEIIRNGGLVAFNTETVYGLGANALSGEATNSIFLAKGRPSDNPLIVHIADKSYLENIAKEIPNYAKILIEKYWPGPLTLIFKKTENAVPDSVTAGLDTVAVRIPKSPIALDLIRFAGVPIAAPSANTSTKPSPTTANHVFEDLSGKIDMIIDGGQAEFGLESTIIDVSDEEPVLLRPGSITLEMLESTIGNVKIAEKIIDDSKPKAPGMKYKHYSPKAEVTIFLGEAKSVANSIKKSIKSGEDIGIMATSQTLAVYDGFDNVISVGDRLNPESIAKNLFNTLRQFDYNGVCKVYAEGFSEDGVFLAIMNRLLKAAEYRVINVE